MLKRRRAAAILLSAVALAARPSRAVEPARNPARIQAIAELAYALGGAHALRSRCVAPGDGGWRARMTAMMRVEGADAAMRRRLTDRFNAGYLAQIAAFPGCVGPGGRSAAAAERAVLASGRPLAARLAVSATP